MLYQLIETKFFTPVITMASTHSKICIQATQMFYLA